MGEKKDNCLEEPSTSWAEKATLAFYQQFDEEFPNQREIQFEEDKTKSENNHSIKHSQCINLGVLKGHHYEIKYNPRAKGSDSKFSYICRYDGCGK